jgi:hypothetical protein
VKAGPFFQPSRTIEETKWFAINQNRKFNSKMQGNSSTISTVSKPKSIKQVNRTVSTNIIVGLSISNLQVKPAILLILLSKHFLAIRVESGFVSPSTEA